MRGFGMYLTYIDESWKAERSDPEPEYVLAALTINESAWKDVDSRVRGLKQKYFPQPDTTRSRYMPRTSSTTRVRSRT